MDYTPKYNRGAPATSNPSVIAEPLVRYAGETNFFLYNDVDVQQPRLIRFISPSTKVPGYPEYINELPASSQISLFARSIGGGGDGYEKSFEVTLDFGGSLGVVAWLWGGSLGWNPSVQFQGGWIMTVSGILGPCTVYVKSGINGSSSSSINSTISLDAYLHNGACPTRDRINSKCTIPPCSFDGEYLFQRNGAGDRPAVQTAQSQRQFLNMGAFLDLGNAESRVLNVFGGPWVGHATHSADSASVTTEAKGMDADATNGHVVNTTSAQRGQVQIPDFNRYDWNQIKVTNGATTQNVYVSLGLTSPTK